MKLSLISLSSVTLVAGAAFAAAALPLQDRDAAAKKPTVLNLYPLETCAVSGEKLGSMGDPIVKEYDGREVRFCCAGCVEPFESDPAKYLKKVDEQIIASQSRFYPLETCVVMGDPLIEDGEDFTINHVQNNRLFKLCCKMCVNDVKKDPAKWAAKLDEAIIQQQREHYPLDTCLVMADSKLGSMGEPVEVIVANRLIRLCCEGCLPKLKKEPAKYIKALDDAWMKAHAADGAGH